MSESVHNGKIGRLGWATRQELNERMADGEQGQPLSDWLNAQPGVKLLVAREFEGEPVTKQNLSAWRHGGYAEWDRRRELLGRADDLSNWAYEMEGSIREGLADDLATMVLARYAGLLLSWDGGKNAEFEERLGLLRGLSQDVMRLQRGQQRSARLEMAQEKHGWEEFEFERKLEELKGKAEWAEARGRALLEAVRGMKEAGEWEEPEVKDELQLKQEREEMEREEEVLEHDKAYAKYQERQRKRKAKAQEVAGNKGESRRVKVGKGEVKSKEAPTSKDQAPEKIQGPIANEEKGTSNIERPTPNVEGKEGTLNPEPGTLNLEQKERDSRAGRPRSDAAVQNAVESGGIKPNQTDLVVPIRPEPTPEDGMKN